MNRSISLIIVLLLIGCQKETKLFDGLNSLAEFDRDYKLTLIQTGKESGFIEPLSEYSIYKIDSLEFKHLQNSIYEKNKFKEDKYYWNIELGDYLYQNNLEILNLSNCAISENRFDKTYHLYLLSDNQSFAVLKINH